MATKKVGNVKQTTQLALSFKGETGDRQIVGRIQRGFTQASGYYRDILDRKKNIVTNLNEVAARYKVSVETMTKISQYDWDMITKIGMSRESKNGSVPPLTKAVKKVLELPDLTMDSQFGHTDVQVSAIAVSNLYKGLSVWIAGTERAVQAARKKNKDNPVANRANMRLAFTLAGGSVHTFEAAPVQGTLGVVKKVRSQIGVLVIAYNRLQQYTASIEGYGAAGTTTGAFGRGQLANMYDNLADDINAVLNDPTFDIEILVEDNINILNQVQVKGEYISKNANLLLGRIESGLTTSAQNIGLKNKNLNANINKMMTKVDWSKVTFSKSLEQTLHEQLLDLAINKKVKKRAGTRKKKPQKVSMKAATVGLKRSNAKAKRKNAVKKNKAVMQAIAQSTTVRGSKEKRNVESNLKELNKLKATINKRLPAETRRQMGRPALINRTGRFSNSVELKSLRATKAGISGEYTYLLSPYETFENTGERRWRTGYNPKPLIAKSIRNLALQYTKERFVSLRRT